MAAFPALERRMVRLEDAVLEVFTGGSGEALICSTHQYLSHQDITRSARAAPFIEALATTGRVVREAHVFVDDGYSGARLNRPG